MMVLASALAAKVKWREPFTTRPRDAYGRSTDPAEQWLSRTTNDPGAAAILDGTVTRVIVEGDGDVDVHLVLGDSQPAEVLAAALRELSGEAEVRPVTDVDDSATGLTVRRVKSSDPDDILRVALPSFEIRARHNLMDQKDLFGLGALTNSAVSHLPLLSPAPLFVSEGVQSVLARFFAEGFEAAAVTAFGVYVTGGPPPTPYEITHVNVDFDRPFGFIAVHRPSRLAVVAGWVSSPFQEVSQE